MSSAASVVALPSRPLGRLLDLIEHYVVMSEEQRLVVALWIVHSHCVARFDQTPYLAITSPEKQCGKSRLLELLALLTPRAWYTTIPTEAVLYRSIEAYQPTLLLDEVDAVFNPKTANLHEGLRAALNAGHRRGATVRRCVGPKQKLTDFDVYCAKVLAGIGTLPDTIADRSIPIRLQRKTASERVERFRVREVELETQPIRDRVAEWAETNAYDLAEARPDMPDELSDRMQEGCECLVAIADALGYGNEARQALIALLATDRLDTEDDAKVRLLRDVREAFAREGDPERIWTTELLDLLKAPEGSEWAAWYDKGLTDRGLAKMLKPYGIAPRQIRIGEENARGYALAEIKQAADRYIPATAADEADVTAVTPVTATPGVRLETQSW